MPRRDTTDFVAAFAVGAVLGVSLALLLRPDPPTPVERIRKDLVPHRKRMRKDARRIRKSLDEGASATADMGGALREASREVLHDFRDEVVDIVTSAREELSRSAHDRVTRTKKALRRGTRRLGRA